MAEVSLSSSAPHSSPAWARVLMPSATDLIFVALLGMLVFTPLSVRLLGDAGIGWHIRTGQQILATHAVPHMDSFSSPMGGKPWFAWEWLYDIIVGKLEATLGLNGVVWLTAIVIAAVFAGTFRLMIVRGTNVVVAVVLVLTAVSASMIHFLARPHVLSWLFSLAWFWILDRSETRNFSGNEVSGKRSLLWILPLSMLLWVNLHGGFLLAFVLLVIFWASAAWEWLTTSDGNVSDLLHKIGARRRARNLMFVGMLSTAATLVNPYGWKLNTHIYSYLSNRFLMDHIDEFQSPNFHGVAQKCFAALILITFVALAFNIRKVRVSEVLLILFAVYSGLLASRNIPVSAMLLVLVAGPLLSGLLEKVSASRRQISVKPGFLNRIAATEASLRGHLWPAVTVIATVCIAANGGRVGSSVLMDAHFDFKRMPVAAVDYLEKNDVRGQVLAPDYWGGYLIYRMYPKIQVVVDDRHDMYGEEFFKSYLKMVHVEPGWDDFLQKYPASCLLLPKAAPLANILLATGGWKVIYEDDVAKALVLDSVGHGR
jgi:hypothetical protein